MTVAEKILRAKADLDAVYDTGYEKGKEDAGGDVPVYTGEVEVRNNGKAS